MMTNPYTRGSTSGRARPADQRQGGFKPGHEQRGGPFGRNKSWKRPNALKHGAFATAAIMPGEDPAEFQRLYADLVGEWMPDGPLEEDTIFSIAKSIWRKRRAQEFRAVQMMTNALDVGHPAFDETFCLHGFAVLMEHQPETAFDEYGSRCLRPDKVEYLKQKFPRAGFGSTAEWSRAVINEINSVLLPATAIGATKLPKVARDFTRKFVSLRSTAQSGDLLEKELALEECLDAMIDRLVKRLIQQKAMKQMLNQAHTVQADDRPRVLAVRRTSNGS